MFCALLVTVIAVALAALYSFYNRQYKYWAERGVPFVNPSFPFGILNKVAFGQCGMNQVFQEAYSKSFGKYVGLYFFYKPALLIRDPDLIRIILVREFGKFASRGVYVDEEADPTSGHLFKLSGERWRFIRSRLTPAFSSAKLRALLPSITEAGCHLERHLKQLLHGADDDAKDGLILDVSDLALRFSTSMIASTVFGLEMDSFQDNDNEYNNMAKQLFERGNTSMMVTLTLQVTFQKIMKYLPIEVVSSAHSRFVGRMVRKVIKYRETEGVERPDLMQLLMGLRDGEKKEENSPPEKTPPPSPNRGKFTLNDVVAQAYTMFYAGHETTGQTLMYMLYECARNPHVQKLCQEEIDRVLEKHAGSITYDAVNEMTYVDMVIAETLRLYPTLAFLNRKALEDYELPDGLVITKGTRLVISNIGLHYDPDIYPEPETFDPLRFSPEQSALRSQYSYLPFGSGPMTCIGKRLALISVCIGAVTILRHYSLTVCSKTPIPLKFYPKTLALKPITSIWLKFNKR